MRDCDGPIEELDCCGGAGGDGSGLFAFDGYGAHLVGYLALPGDAGFLLDIDATGGAGVAGLPAAAGVPAGTVVVFRKSDATANAITITPQGGDTITGEVVLASQFQTLAYTRTSAATWALWAAELPGAIVGTTGATDNQVPVADVPGLLAARTIKASPLNIDTAANEGRLKIDTGGAARGVGARDWQSSRAAAAQVASGARAAILNGQNNTAAGADSTSCGRANDVQSAESGNFSGNTNEIGPGGGYHGNVAGRENLLGQAVPAFQIFNGGGFQNVIDNDNAANIGGHGNAIAAADAANAGGADNAVDGARSANVAGSSNEVHGADSANAAGIDNVVTVAATEAFSGGGNGNTLSGVESANIGGESNQVMGLRAANAGGQSNIASGQDSANVGGRANLPSANKSANLGGEDNDIQVGAENAANVGGTDKTFGATADSAAALGGNIITINGARSVALGGQNNQIDGDDSAVMGSGNYVAGAGAFATGKDAAADRPAEVAQGAGSGTQGAAQGGTLIYAASIPGGVVTELDLANVAGEYLDLLDGDNYAVSVREANAKVGGAFSAAAWFANAANAGMIWREAGVTAGLFSGPQLGLMNDALVFAPTLELFADVANNRLAVYVDNTTGPDAYAVVVLTYAKRNG